MRVWITRTEPGATRLATEIRRLGLATFKAPVLRIEPRRIEPPQGPFDLALFVSEHAVAHAARNGWAQAPWRGCPTAAIGASASDALRQHGIEPCLAAVADAASVFDALTAVPRRTLIVKGQGGRDVLQRTLRQHGGTVVEWDVYRRVAANPDLAGQDVDAIVAGSGAGVRAIAKIWFAAGRDAATPLLAPSPRVAELAAQAGFENVVVTLGASAAAVGTALRPLAQRTGNGERELG